MPRVGTIAVCLLVVASAATACSSSKGISAPDTTLPPPTTAYQGANPTSPSSTLFVQGNVPAVSGATDLSKEPGIAPGQGNPPTVLTGKDLVVGTGAQAAAHDTVLVQYVGALWSTGKVFDASWTDSGPTTFSLDGVVPGFADAIIGMRTGGRREIVIPPALGYGASGNPPLIPANATLVFVIDLIQVNPS